MVAGADGGAGLSAPACRRVSAPVCRRRCVGAGVSAPVCRRRCVGAGVSAPVCRRRCDGAGVGAGAFDSGAAIGAGMCAGKATPQGRRRSLCGGRHLKSAPEHLKSAPVRGRDVWCCMECQRN